MTIRNFIIGLLLLSASLYAGCKKEEFNYQPYHGTVADIDSIFFSAGDVRMIADGKATLKFVIETYKTITKSNGEVVRTFLDYRELPKGSVKVFEEVTNKEVGDTTFIISSMPADTLRFYAQVGNIKSPVKKVALRPVPAAPPKLYVDVIFHVWELNPTNTTYDVSSYQSTKYEDIVKGLQIMNDVVNNKLGNSPNGAPANVEFRLATKNQAGQTLAIPGYNKIIYSDEVKANAVMPTISLADFIQYINKNVATYIWTPESYLNVHVLPSGSNNSLGNLWPTKQLPPAAGETVIPGMSATSTGPADYVKDFVNVTVFMPNTLFNPGYERRIEIFSYIGNFYGLYPTSAYSTTRAFSDWCEDTPDYNPQDTRNNFFFATKTGLTGEKFVIENAMDDTRYPSSRNSLTLDQVKRMRAVMAKCPGRMNTKTQ